MDVTQTLIEQPADSDRSTGESCPNCAKPGSGLGLEVAVFPGRPIRRCTRCGVRHTVGDEPNARVFHCNDCGLPFLTDIALDAPLRRCRICSSPDRSAAPDTEVAHATEREVRATLQSEWRFVSAPSLSAYLDRLLRQLKPLLAGDLEHLSVEVFEDSRWWSFALPSGTVLLSVGTLSGLQDEAELLFVLAHELAHAAAADAGERLARVGLHAVVAEGNAESTVSWSRAAHDVVRLGYGRQREVAADAQAFHAVAELGYDLEAIGRYLRRLDSMLGAGDSRITELAVAHPLPSSRLRRLESFGANRPVPRHAPRTNREVFRRAAGHSVLDATLEQVEGLQESPAAGAADSAGKPAMTAVRLTLLLSALAALAGVAAWYFLPF